MIRLRLVITYGPQLCVDWRLARRTLTNQVLGMLSGRAACRIAQLSVEVARCDSDARSG